MNRLFHKITLVFFLLAVALQANAQTNTAYYARINEAEVLVTDSLFAEALVKYKQAFSLQPAATANAYYNAAVCATLTGKNKDAFTYLGKLKCKGIALDEIQEQQVFISLMGTKEWQKFSKQYQRSASNCTDKINQSYRDTLLAMVASDQHYYRIRAELASNKTDSALLAAYVDSIDYITNRNTDAFLRLVARNGFPSENLVGATKPDGAVFYNILLRHAVQRGRRDILPVLLTAVQNGELSPHIYAYHAEYFEKAKFGSTVVRGTASGTQELPFSPEAEEAKNQERARLGMESLADLRKKANFSSRDKRFYINKPNSTVRFFKSREEMLQYRRENSL
ncbi:hypothetical protein [Pontibacter mangrovi]|uniref:Tetratricopeptide repeat protein n=1 Tax=Pontibacter mangrovi TaxID=2589816 RepID=A0A501WI99_9BACT|nr:hypothetical protein [Pontibacter mangrovi]TPE45326.1 hypothetical protein FJM65_04620 [Pontibacter mangrovi]